MKTMAHIFDGKVVNVSVWDGLTEWHPDEDTVEIPPEVPAGIGWDYIGGRFIDNRPRSEEPGDM